MKLTLAFSVVLLVGTTPDCQAQERLGLFGRGNGQGNGNNGQGNGRGNGRGNGNGGNSVIKVKTCNGRKCDIDISNLAFGESISFQKGNGQTVKCNKAQRGNNGKTNKWVGECEGSGNANLIKRGEKLFGSLVDGEDICQFSPDYDGNNRVVCTPAADFPPEADPQPGVEEVEVVEGEDGSFRHLVANPIDKPSSFPPRTSALKGTSANFRNQTRRGLLDDLGGNMDIMVVWTKRAECANSGLGAGCSVDATTKENMISLVEAAIEETNAAYDMSGIQTSLRLVHAYRDPNYVEVGSDAFRTALYDLTYTTDGAMDDVHQKRTDYGADIVAMLIDDDQYCGIGWIGPRVDLMFSVTAWNCATGTYSFAHEVGHNMGCEHDRGTKGACSASGYNYGYRDTQGGFRSIMSYRCRTGQCDGNPGGTCSRTQMFSNSDPAYTVNGRPIGNAQNDNARQIDESRSIVARYYPFQETCQTDADCTTSDACSPGVCDGVCSFPPLDCDDNDACTADSCSNGNCANTPISCDDGNACTTDGCDAVTGCTHSLIPNCCGNGICEAGSEDAASCPEDCFEGPFTLATNLCSSCFIKQGLMFDMEALTNIQVTSLKLYAYSSGTAEIWTRPGTHVGFTYSDSGWTKVAEHSFTTNSFQLVEIPESSFTETVSVDANTRQAFYVTLQGNQYQLYNSDQQSTDAVNVENTDVKIFEGPAKSYLFGPQTGPRVWNGEITYMKASD